MCKEIPATLTEKAIETTMKLETERQRPTAIEYLRKGVEAQISQGRTELIEALEWLIRDLNREVGQLKSNQYSVNTSILTGSLVHTIEHRAVEVHVLEKTLCNLKTAQQFDKEEI